MRRNIIRKICNKKKDFVDDSGNVDIRKLIEKILHEFRINTMLHSYEDVKEYIDMIVRVLSEEPDALSYMETGFDLKEFRKYSNIRLVPEKSHEEKKN